MSDFTKMVSRNPQDDSFSLEISRKGVFEIGIKVFTNETYKLYFGESKLSLTTDELKKVLQLVVPFCIESAQIHGEIRRQDSERL